MTRPLTEDERNSIINIWNAASNVMMLMRYSGLTKEEALICSRLLVKYFEVDILENRLLTRPDQDTYKEFDEFLTKEIIGDHQR